MLQKDREREREREEEENNWDSDMTASSAWYSRVFGIYIGASILSLSDQYISRHSLKVSFIFCKILYDILLQKNYIN